MKFSEMSKEQIESLMSGKSLSSGKSGKGGGRKEEVLNILKEGLFSIEELSIKVGVSRRNISSVICYLKDDGFVFRNLGERIVLWGKIVDGKKVGNRIELGEGKVVRYDFEKGLFEDEVKVEEVKVEEKKKK